MEIMPQGGNTHAELATHRHMRTKYAILKYSEIS